MVKYSESFQSGFKWLLKVRRSFTFSGDILRDKEGNHLEVPFSLAGISGKECYFKYDSTGRILPTKHPLLVYSVLKTKASVNFQIKEWALDRASGLLPRIEFDKIIEEFNLPEWAIKAVENQALKKRRQDLES